MVASIKEALLELSSTGCQGNFRDYVGWVRYAHPDLKPDDSSIETNLTELAREGILVEVPGSAGEFAQKTPVTFPPVVEYTVSGMLIDSPIQLVRSRLESFLQFHKTSEEDLMDITIATTEAMENAVKYSDHTRIDVFYSIESRLFRIKIVNPMGETTPEKDIEAGKYSGSATLMRGVMVMVKLFDEMDIDIAEADRKAIFVASKKLR